VEVLEIIQPGLLTTVQDRGRYGYQRYGVPVSGAMDSYALTVANLLVGNDEGAGALEMTVLGPRLQVLGHAEVALTGADLSPMLNSDPFPMWEAVEVRCGDIISFRQPLSGCRSYLAVVGGIDVPEVMGSRSTYVRSCLGGFEGRALLRGDRLSSGEAAVRRQGCKVPARFVPQYCGESELRVVLGPQDDWFTDKGIRTFLGSEYVISVESDRMGCRLEGAPVEHKAGADIVSDGVPAGAVQVPGDGLPIILMADRQTTGGYAKIATVITIDLPRIAQTAMGDRVRFSAVTQEQAYDLAVEYERNMDALREYIRRAG
jgi:antagonist of KipI